jgi:hypothetical protein
MNIGIEKKNGIRIVRGNATLKTKSSWREREGGGFVDVNFKGEKIYLRKSIVL